MADGDLDLDGLAARIVSGIKGALGGSGGGGDDLDDLDLDTGGRGKVSVDRLRREIDKRRAVEAKLAELGTTVEQLAKGFETQLTEIKTTASDEVKRITQSHAEDLALVDSGLTDPLGRQALRLAWQSQPKESRGKSPADWWGQTIEATKAHAADPEKVAAPNVPKILTPYLPVADAGDGQQKQAGAPPRASGKAAVKSIEAVPTDQGIGAFLAGLREIR